MHATKLFCSSHGCLFLFHRNALHCAACVDNEEVVAVLKTTSINQEKETKVRRKPLDETILYQSFRSAKVICPDCSFSQAQLKLPGTRPMAVGEGTYLDMFSAAEKHGYVSEELRKWKDTLVAILTGVPQ